MMTSYAEKLSRIFQVFVFVGLFQEVSHNILCLCLCLLLEVLLKVKTLFVRIVCLIVLGIKVIPTRAKYPYLVEFD